MKTRLLAPFLAMISMTSLASAGGDAIWTSNEGTSIRARLAGWDGVNFILIKDGLDYRVPVSRLSPESAEKARRELDAAGAVGPTPPAPRSGQTAEEISRLARVSSSVQGRAGMLPRDRHGLPEYGFRETARVVRTTAYTSTESDHLVYGNRNAIGTTLKFSGEVRSAAADWSRYPVGTTFRIKGLPWLYVVDDYGSALSGAGTIDLYQPDMEAMRAWGCRRVEIVIVKWGSLSRSESILSGRTGYRHCREMLEEVVRQRALVSRMASR